MALMLRFRRKVGSGPLIAPGKKKRADKPFRISRKDTITYHPGDEITVPSEKDLPGYPYQVDGWEYMGKVEVADKTPPEPIHKDAKLAIKHVGRGFYNVVIEAPNLAFLDAKGSPLLKGTKLNSDFLIKARAEEWVKTGADPGEGFGEQQ